MNYIRDALNVISAVYNPTNAKTLGLEIKGLLVCAVTLVNVIADNMRIEIASLILIKF